MIFPSYEASNRSPQAPQARGAQRGSREHSEQEPARRSLAWSRNAERSRAFVVRGTVSNQSSPSVTPALGRLKLSPIECYVLLYSTESVVECADGVEVIPNGLHEGSVALEILQCVVDDVVIDDVPVGMGQHVPEPSALRHLFS